MNTDLFQQREFCHSVLVFLLQYPQFIERDIRCKEKCRYIVVNAGLNIALISHYVFTHYSSQ